MARRYGFYDTWYTPTKPKEVKGGIKAQSKRGSFVKKWWGKRWIETIESFRIGARLSRGRSYARKGQVADLDIGHGKVTAKVQGSRSGAYRISITLRTFSGKEWRKVIDKLVEQPVYAARLLGNEMPEDIETVFSDVGLSLFPKKRNDLETECSCPDWSNPCKHIAAVFYLMAEAFDNDPFLLFRLRGMEREEFLRHIQVSYVVPQPDEVDQELTSEPLSDSPDVFWGEPPTIISSARISPVSLHAAFPKRLGPLPFWRADSDFTTVMEQYYRDASSCAVNKIASSAEA